MIRRTPLVEKFDTADYPEDQRLDALFDFYRERHSDESRVGDIRSFRYKANIWNLGPLKIGRSFVSQVQWIYPGTSSLETLVLRVANTGGTHGVISNRPYCSVDGGVSLTGSRHSFVLDRRNSDQIVISIPGELVGLRPDSDSCHFFHPKESPEAVFVTRFVNQLWNSVSSFSEREAELAANGVCGMVRGLMSPGNKKNSERNLSYDKKRKMVQDYIDENLSGVNLDIDEMCKDFGLSRSSLFRLFGEYGGVRKYLQNRRLEQAYVNLSLTKSSPGLIGEIAEKYRFSDIAHFSKAFRARFDTSPRNILGTASLMSTSMASQAALGEQNLLSLKSGSGQF